VTAVAEPQEQDAAEPAGALERDSPYQGLVPYSDRDAAFFFGRNAWRRVVVDYLQAYRVSLFYGASGVGKSSILRAGVTHQLREQSKQTFARTGTAEFAVVEFASWQGDALEGFKAALTASMAEISPELARDPPQGTLADVLREWSDRISSEESDVRALILVILDQFEEYFVYHQREEGPGLFATELIDALERRDVPANVLISIREDALDKLDKLEPGLGGVYDHLLRFEHLDRDAAREAIVGPIDRWRELTGEPVEVEPDLVKAVLDQVRTGRVRFGERGRGRLEEEKPVEDDALVEAPYLQLVMMRLWEEERRQKSRVLRAETLRRLGGAERIVRRHLDETLAALPRRERTTAARLFAYLVTPDERKIAVPATALATWTKRDPRRVETVLKKLSGGDQRILRAVAAPGEDAMSYEIFHDRLAKGVLEYASRYRQRRLWRRWGSIGVVGLLVAALVVAGLLQQNAQLASDRSQLTQIVSTAYLKTVLRGQRGPVTSVSFTPDGSKILTSSTDGTARLWNAATGATVRVFHANSTLDAALYALPQPSIWPAKVVAAGDDVDVWDATTGKLLASLPVAHRPSTIETVLGSVTVSATNLRAGRLARVFVGQGDPKRPFLLRAAGPLANDVVREYVASRATIVEADADGKVRLYTYRLLTTPGSGVETHTFDAGPSPLTHVTLDRSAKLIATSSAARRIVVMTRDGKRVFTARAEGRIDGLRFSPDSRLLVVAEDDGHIAVASARAGRVLAELPCGTGSTDVAFSPDGRLFAAGCSDGTHVWDARTWKLVTTLGTTGDGTVGAIAFSPDGKLLLAGTEEGSTEVWITPAKPDLALGVPKVNLVPSGVMLTVKVRNMGAAAAGSTSLSVTLEGVKTPTTVGVPALGPGAFAYAALTVPYPRDLAGQHARLALVLDPQKVVDQTTRRNDLRSTEVALPPGPVTTVP
jgi:WD40 repeat protein